MQTKEQRRIVAKAWEDAHREERLLYKKQNSKIYREKNKESYKAHDRTVGRRFSNAKSKAKSRNIEFSLTLQEYTIAINKPCFYCNNNLCKPIEVGIGLDRLDSNIGYIQGNVVSCGKICNQIKNDCLTPIETKVAVEAIITYRKQLQGN